MTFMKKIEYFYVGGTVMVGFLSFETAYAGDLSDPPRTDIYNAEDQTPHSRRSDSRPKRGRVCKYL